MNSRPPWTLSYLSNSLSTSKGFLKNGKEYLYVLPNSSPLPPSFWWVGWCYRQQSNSLSAHFKLHWKKGRRERRYVRIQRADHTGFNFANWNTTPWSQRSTTFTSITVCEKLGERKIAGEITKSQIWVADHKRFPDWYQATSHSCVRLNKCTECKSKESLEANSAEL